MRRILMTLAALVLLVSPSSFAQEWVQYASKADLFGVNFPSEPKVQDIAYATEFGITLPGHVYSAEQGQSRYSVTAVDLKDAEKIHTERVAQCKAKGGEGDACTNDWRADVQGSMIFASWKFIQRNAKVTHFGWSVVDQVEGLRLQLTNADGSRTFAEIHRHGTRLYILEATVPPRAPAPGIVSAVAHVHRRRRQVDSLSVALHDRIFRSMAVPRPDPPRTGPPPAPAQPK